MANTPQEPHRNAGKPGAPDATTPPLNQTKGSLSVPDSGEHSVKPLPGDSGGVADGQVTKSN